MTISVFFDPPLETDSSETFIAKAEDTVGKLNTWSQQANALATTMNFNSTNMTNTVTLGLAPENLPLIGDFGSSAFLNIEFLAALILAGGVGGSLVKVTGATYSVLATDTDIEANRAGTVTLTLPSASLFPNRRINVRTITANTVVSGSSDVVPVAGGAAGTAILAATAGKWCELMSDGTNWLINKAG